MPDQSEMVAQRLEDHIKECTNSQSGQTLHLSYNIVVATTSVTFNPTWSSTGTQVTPVGSLKGY